MIHKKIRSVLVLATIGCLLGCTSDRSKANQLVKQANSKIPALVQDLKNSTEKHDKAVALFKSKSPDPKEITALLQDADTSYQALAVRSKELADLFETASKMKVSGPPQQQWSLLSQVWNKQQQLILTQKEKVQTLLDGMKLPNTPENVAILEKRLTAAAAKTTQLQQEAETLANQAKKTFEDNRSAFEE